MAAVELRVPGYKVLAKAGSGSDAEVFLCIDRKTRKKVAVKAIEKGAGAQERLNRSYKEVQLMGLLDHPHVVRFVFDIQIASQINC